MSWLVEWLKALDWSHWDSVVSATVGVTVLAGIAWAAIKFVLNPLAVWLGRRRAQAKLLDQLACGSSVEYVESLFGVAQFVGQRGGNETRTYRLAGAWVIIEIRDRAVFSYSITVTNPRMHYNTKRLTFNMLKIRLGKDKFPKRGIGYGGEHLWVAIRLRHGYVQHYNLREAGAMQFYWLSHNQAGAGQFYEDFSYADRGSGVFAHDHSGEGEPIDASGITVNTLTVASPELIHTETGAFLAIDESEVKLASAVRPPLKGTRRYRLGLKWFKLKGWALRALASIGFRK
ncbi:ETEC_3214 domain-containing protein [Mycobacterium sp. 155]|uniref:ETEC_3214 domain-containing protein n=1 Tax=Mycobacterium sp. 155 TaxID=1157943 RepID=UPI0012F7CE8C|nr:ETEC_3214 domain-containing protein [Mycobacterium sp. 155]